MNDRATILTISGTSTSQEIKLTRNVEGNKNLMLANMSLYIKVGETAGVDVIPKIINLQLGNTIDSFYVIDSTEGQNTLELINKYNPVAINADRINICEYEPRVMWYFSGQINKSMTVKVLDQDYLPLDGLVTGADSRPLLLSYTFQFQVI